MRAFSRFLPLVLSLASLGACKTDYQVTAEEGRLVVSPALTDLGTVSVGSSHPISIDLISAAGEIRILAVELLNVDGEGFSLDPQDLPEISREGEAALSLLYAPTDEGYHWARLSIQTDEPNDSLHEVDLRARAVLPSLQIWPRLVEFGPVEPGEVGTERVTIANLGEIAIEIQALDIPDDTFASELSLPLEVAAGSQEELELTFTPTDSEAHQVEASLELGSGVTPELLTLQANSCESADGSRYDVDADGYSWCGTDCDDRDDEIHPGAIEICDGIDQDCDGIVDEQTSCADDDGDGYSEDDGDCNDSDATISPALVEVLGNGVDDDCDGVTDSGESDVDGDGYTETGGDCEPTDSAIHPGATEIANGVDDDCDGTIDEGTTAYDDDGDCACEGISCSGSSDPSCTILIGGDCDDSDPRVVPNGLELPDWLDNDCDGRVDEGTENADDDGDGYSELGGDCDDSDSSINPGEIEQAGDGIDNDCDGVTE